MLRGVDEQRAWTPAPGALPLAGDLEPVLFRFGFPRDFGRAYRQELEQAANIDVFLNANAVEIQPFSDLRAVEASW
jgi:hypothetical protein